MARIRSLPVAVALAIVLAGCGSTVPPPPMISLAPNPTGAAASPGASAQASTAPSSPDAAANVPADIAADVDALLAATTTDATIAATRTILEKSGVVITDDPASVEPTPAGMYLPESELLAIASEASAVAGTSRASFADFAATFGGLAGLPPNETLLDDYAQLDLGMSDVEPPSSPDPNASPLPLSDETLDADLGSLPAHMATFLTTWVGLAQSQHGASQPDLVQLTNAPLYIQALAARQLDPIDVSRAFSPSDLQLGSLQLTLLIAGMRAHLAYAQSGILDASKASQGFLASVQLHHLLEPDGAQQAFADCDQLRHLIDAHVPVVTSVVGIATKTYIKDQIKGFVEGLFGKATDIAQAVGPAFSALGLLFRVAALVMLYEHSVAKLKIEPGLIHKPTDSPQLAAAILEAGIPDAEWEAAKQQRANDPWYTALRTCAQLLGIPAPSDLINVGEGMAGWKVQWAITKGLGTDIRMHEGELLGPGAVASRRERPLQLLNDHSGTDTLALDVLTEKQTDHPGTEYTDIARVCAGVLPKEPPDGFKTFLKAGLAGKSLAGSFGFNGTPYSAIFKLISITGDLLMGWYRAVSPINACQNMSVTFHKPTPMPWRGRVTLNYMEHVYIERHFRGTSGRGTGPHGEPFTTVGVTKSDTDVTAEYFVGGMDDAGFSGQIMLDGSAYTHGVENYFEYQFRDWYTSFCRVQEEKVDSGGGGWSFDGESNGFLELSSDGSYIMQVHTSDPDDEITVPGTKTDDIAIIDGDCSGIPDEGPSGRSPIYTSPPYADSIVGQIDPQNPGDRLTGTQTVFREDGTEVVITWDLQHQGPIHLPEF